MPLVTQWIGRGIKAFRTAIRMSVLEFAHKLGVSDRIVTRWETGGAEDIPRMVNQAALDTLLAQADPDVHGRFLGLLAASDGPALHQLVEPEKNEILSGRYTKHPRDGRLMAHVPEGIFLSGTDCEPTWVDEFYIDTFPVTNADYARFCTATGHAPPRHSEGGRCPRPLYDHPAVEVSWRDACAFADWAGESLPSALQLRAPRLQEMGHGRQQPSGCAGNRSRRAAGVLLARVAHGHSQAPPAHQRGTPHRPKRAGSPYFQAGHASSILLTHSTSRKPTSQGNPCGDSPVPRAAVLTVLSTRFPVSHLRCSTTRSAGSRSRRAD